LGAVFDSDERIFKLIAAEPFAHQEVEAAHKRPCSIERRVEVAITLDHAAATHHIHVETTVMLCEPFVEDATVGSASRWSPRTGWSDRN
jgi:hypothetical protein